MNNKNLTIIWNAGFLLIAICLLTLGSFLDTEISVEMYSGENFFGYFGTVFGKMPAYLIMAMSFSFLFTAGRRRGFRGLDLALNVVYLLGVVLSFTLMFQDASELLLKDESRTWQILFAVIIGVVFSVLCVKIYKRVDDETLLKLKKWSIASIASIVIIMLLIFVLKLGWGRARFIDVNSGNAEFTQWWTLQGNTGGDSFPSGHVALAACSLFFLPFIDIVTEGNFKSLIVADVFCTAFTLLTAFFRIMGGFHFMSDVAMSMILVTLVHYIAMRVAYGIEFNRFYFRETNFLNRL